MRTRRAPEEEQAASMEEVEMEAAWVTVEELEVLAKQADLVEQREGPAVVAPREAPAEGRGRVDTGSSTGRW